MYIFDSEPDEYGEPVLISHSINLLSNNNPIKRLGVDVNEKHNYFLVVKLVDESESGEFVIRLIFEYRLSFLLILLVLNMTVLIYEIKKKIQFSGMDRNLNSDGSKKAALKRKFLLINAISLLSTAIIYVWLSNVIIGAFFFIFISIIVTNGFVLLLSLISRLIKRRRKVLRKK